MLTLLSQMSKLVLWSCCQLPMTIDYSNDTLPPMHNPPPPKKKIFLGVFCIASLLSCAKIKGLKIYCSNCNFIGQLHFWFLILRSLFVPNHLIPVTLKIHVKQYLNLPNDSSFSHISGLIVLVWAWSRFIVFISLHKSTLLT